MSKYDLHVYHVFYSTVTGFKKSQNFASIQRTLVTNFIGSIIGLQVQEHIEIVETIRRSREFH